MTPRKRGRITATRLADENNAVITVVGGGQQYRRKPCQGCPWVVENDGSFPAEAFRISAPTSYDLADSMFACHESPERERPLTCAGFLLRNADNNLAARMAQARGTLDLSQVKEDGRELHTNYREMAIANGVDPDDPVLANCRGDGEY